MKKHIIPAWFATILGLGLAATMGSTWAEDRVAVTNQVTPVHAAATDKPPGDINAVMNNIAILKTEKSGTAVKPALVDLKKELETLWDYTAIHQQPLEIEIVSSVRANGYLSEGLYFNGASNELGQDRIFCYFTRPEKPEENRPVYLDLSGGFDEQHGLWLAKTLHCAALEIEWRSPHLKFNSRWAGGPLTSMKNLTRLKDNVSYRVITAARRAIDYLETQPGIDRNRIAAGGYSMGGYYTLLLAGVDQRVAYGWNELGGGHLAQTDSALGQFEMSPEAQAIWLQAFDPDHYAGITRAKILASLSANDFFFWLGDAVENFRALPGEKRLCIGPNFNHNVGAFGKSRPSTISWLSYCFGQETSFPDIISTTNQQGRWSLRLADAAEIKAAQLYFSPGAHLAWPARYWVEIPAHQAAETWQAVLPPALMKMAGVGFMAVQDRNDRRVTSLPEAVTGADPQTASGTLWADEQLWDTEHGVAAWRTIGPAVRSGPSEMHVAFVPPHGLSIGPAAGSKRFSLVTDSFILACGQAQAHRGLKIDVDGKGQTGELKVRLVRNFGAIKRQSDFSATLTYGPGLATYPLPWNQFQNPNNQSAMLFPFDSLRLDGERADGSALTIICVAFL